MQKLIFFLIFLFFSCSSMISRVFDIPDELYQFHNRSSVKHAGHFDPLTETGKWLNYLVIDLPYPPIKRLRQEIEETFQVDLTQTEKKRGKEAHLTVLTPPEYWSLHSHLKMQEINAKFLDQLQKLTFRIKCLAKAEKDGIQTFFLVAESEEIIQFREKIYQLFISNGGDPRAFNPRVYYPHITVGFNKRDLHERDEILKSSSYCVANIKDKFSLEQSK